MGTNTDFTGAIRITPCVEEPLATRLSQFMDIRHMKRDGKPFSQHWKSAKLSRCLAMEILERMVHSSCPSIRGISRAASVCTNAMRKGSQMSVT